MIQFKNLQKYKNIIHGVLERKDGPVNVFSNPENKNNVLKALKKLGHKAKIENLIFAEQIHSSNIYCCPENISGYIKFQTDGLISQTPGQILVVKTADCLPILIYSPKEKKVGAIHAGSKGILKGIVEKAIKMFNFPSFLIVGIGPHIRSCCYYLRDRAKKYIKMPHLREYIQKRENKHYFNLTQIVIDKLLKSGVKKENIEDCGICTFCEADRFYSARKMEKEGVCSVGKIGESSALFFSPKVKKSNFYSGACFGSFIGLK